MDPGSGRPYRYDADGFEATRYELSTDQFGTQLDPPAHWAPADFGRAGATHRLRAGVLRDRVGDGAAGAGFCAMA